MNNLNNMHSIFLTDDESIISLRLSGSSVGLRGPENPKTTSAPKNSFRLFAEP